MKVDMLMPQMGESITEATISRWLKKVGDTVAMDEIILEISTDKVDSEIPSPAAGVISEILFQEGDVVPVKTAIARIDTAAQGSTRATTQTPVQKDSPPQQPSSSSAEPLRDSSTQEQSASSETRNSKGPISPVVKELAAKNNVSLDELNSIAGSGEGGRVTKADFLAYLEQRSTPKALPSAGTPAAKPQASAASPTVSETAKSIRPSGAAPMPAIGEWGPDGTKVVPMDTMRQAIAEHMVRSKHTSPHVYSVQEVDLSAVAKWRAKYKDEFKKKEGFNLSVTPFFLEAAVKALLNFPIVNASVADKKIIYKKHINLGCAVALGTSGLIVPVIKHAEERNLVGLARALNDLAERARTKKLLPGDVQGGTFTTTNVGGFGTIIGTPIINQPQVAILCIGAMQKKPVVVDDMIAIRERCYLTLSYDHRVIDGAVGGGFLAFVRQYLEEWDMDRALYG